MAILFNFAYMISGLDVFPDLISTFLANKYEVNGIPTFLASLYGDNISETFNFAGIPEPSILILLGLGSGLLLSAEERD